MLWFGMNRCIVVRHTVEEEIQNSLCDLAIPRTYFSYWNIEVVLTVILVETNSASEKVVLGWMEGRPLTV
jgi:hypothetical protein